ncbi:MAG: hypothetical protein ACI4HQ_07545 [Acetatifactor sp.]
MRKESKLISERDAYFTVVLFFLKNKVLEAYDALEHFDLTKNAHRRILDVVLGNAVILFIISSLWIGGFAVTVVYSFLLYFILKKYISNLQKKIRNIIRGHKPDGRGKPEYLAE